MASDTNGHWQCVCAHHYAFNQLGILQTVLSAQTHFFKTLTVDFIKARHIFSAELYQNHDVTIWKWEIPASLHAHYFCCSCKQPTQISVFLHYIPLKLDWMRKYRLHHSRSWIIFCNILFSSFVVLCIISVERNMLVWICCGRIHTVSLHHLQEQNVQLRGMIHLHNVTKIGTKLFFNSKQFCSHGSLINSDNSLIQNAGCCLLVLVGNAFSDLKGHNRAFLTAGVPRAQCVTKHKRSWGRFHSQCRSINKMQWPALFWKLRTWICRYLKSKSICISKL